MYLSGRVTSQEVVLLTAAPCSPQLIPTAQAAMADNQALADDPGKENDFADPLGVMEPIGVDLDDEGNGVVSF